MKNKKRNLVLVAIFAVAGILCIAGGTTYALFNYYKKGTVENTATTGQITFRYDETGINGINLENAIPITDTAGTNQNEENEYFDFTVSTKGTDQYISYNIELEKLTDSTLPEDAVKVYLTELVTEGGVTKEQVESTTINNNNNEIVKFNELSTSNETNNKIIAYGVFSKGNGSQTRTYRLRIWVDKNTDFSPEKNEDGTYKEDSDGNYIYPMNNKTFKVRVNVKASANVNLDGMGDLMAPYCNQKECYEGAEVTLSDNSKWVVIKGNNRYSSDYDYSADNQVVLLSQDYIDAEGNYTTTPVKDSNSSTVYVNNRINQFTTKIKASLSQEDIIVGLPDAKTLGINSFDKDYIDTYFDNNIIGSEKPYILSDETKYDSIRWIAYNNKIYNTFQVNYNNNYYTNYDLSALVRPTITIANNKLPLAQ